MILDGIKLMVLGMGTVLVFLIVMIFFMNLLAKVLAPFAGVLEKAAPAPKKKAAAKKSGDDSLKHELQYLKGRQNAKKNQIHGLLFP